MKPYLEQMEDGNIRDALDRDCFSLSRKDMAAYMRWKETQEGPEPELSYRVRGTCRNHHWMLFSLCQPESFEVSWKTACELQALFSRKWICMPCGSVVLHIYPSVPRFFFG